MGIDGEIEPLAPERRMHERAPMSAQVTLSLHDRVLGAVLRDLSESGALVEVGEALEQGQGVGLSISPDRQEVRAEVVRRDSSGGYGLAFESPMRRRGASTR
jgi:hypothetical protein